MISTDILIIAIPIALALIVTVIQKPIWGIYLYLFGCAILLSGNFPVVREKLAVCDVVMLCVFMSYLVNPQKWPKHGLHPIQNNAIKIGLAYLFVVGISLILNLSNIVKMTRSMVEYATFCYGFCALMAIMIQVDSPRKWRNCLIAWCLGAGVVGLFSTLYLAGIYKPGWGADEFTGRISSTLRESGQVSSYCGTVLPILMFGCSISIVPTRVRILLIACIVPVIIAILGSGSRIAFLILVFAIALTFALRPFFRTRGGVGNAAFWLVALMLIGGTGKFSYDIATDTEVSYAAGKTSPFERPLRIFSEWARGDKEFDDTRMYQIHDFSYYFFNHPIFGIGPGNYGVYYQTHEIHNSYVSSLAETGMLGFGFLLLWLGTVWHAGRESLRYCEDLDLRALIACLMLGFVLLLLYQVTTLGLRQRIWWFIPALILCTPRVVVASLENTLWHQQEVE